MQEGTQQDLVAALIKRHTLTALFGNDVAPVKLGRFDLIKVLGKGGQGTVFRAWDDELGRAVALKVINAPAVSPRPGALRSPEARALAGLDHPCVVAVYDEFDSAHGNIIVQQFVDGPSLNKWLAQPRTRDDKLAVFADVCAGLAAVHASGLVHGDIKPENILLALDKAGGAPRAMLSDFGLSTTANAVMAGGTLGYASPERLAGLPATAASDMFAIGKLAYRMFWGQAASTDPERERQQQEARRVAEQLSGRFTTNGAGLSYGLRAALATTLGEPARRCPATALQALATKERGRRRRHVLTSVFAAVMLAAVGMTYRTTVRGNPVAVCQRAASAAQEPLARSAARASMEAHLRSVNVAHVDVAGRMLAAFDAFDRERLDLARGACEEAPKIARARSQCLRDASLRGAVAATSVMQAAPTPKSLGEVIDRLSLAECRLVVTPLQDVPPTLAATLLVPPLKQALFGAGRSAPAPTATNYDQLAVAFEHFGDLEYATKARLAQTLDLLNRQDLEAAKKIIPSTKALAERSGRADLAITAGLRELRLAALTRQLEGVDDKVKILEARLGSVDAHSVLHGVVLHQKANLLVEQDKLSEAIDAQIKAVALLEANNPFDAFTLAAMSRLASYKERARAPDALAAAQRVYEYALRVQGPYGEATLTAASDYVATLLHADELTRAMELAEVVVAARRLWNDQFALAKSLQDRAAVQHGAGAYR